MSGTAIRYGIGFFGVPTRFAVFVYVGKTILCCV